MTDSININPPRNCDIVMKGGITSGLVYPKAIFEIAKKYRFKNIGGTSAGAIAAGLTAAAEYRRGKGSAEGFEKLNELPQRISEVKNNKSVLLSLFSPNESTKKYYNTLIPLLNRKSWYSTFAYIVLSLFRYCPFQTTFFLLLLAGLEYVCWGLDVSFFIIISIFNILFISTFLIGANCVKFLSKLNKELKINNFGLTTAYNASSENKDLSHTSLTTWLSNMIKDVSGKNEPLTFGDLEDFEDARKIELKMVTTNLNYGIPKSLPFKRNSQKDNWLYYFKESDMRQYFPNEVVEWLKKKSPEIYQDYYALPDASDLPIIVAVRMSLSFPILISAVPFYIRDVEKERKGDNGYCLKKCWFSDGGICSNFPIHFFDSPIPSHPTFAINLRPFLNGRPPSINQKENIYMPDTNSEGLGYEWNYNDSSVFSFLSSIVTTMQNWNDNSMMRMPGYRDRICHVYLSGEEGGLNLNMPSKFIEDIGARGSFAGNELSERFTNPSYNKMNWQNHKWIRFRTTISLLQKYLLEMKNTFEHDYDEKGTTYLDMLTRGPKDPPNSYRLNNEEQKEFIKNKLEEIFILLNDIDIDTRHKTFSNDKDPKPQPELKIRPKF